MGFDTRPVGVLLAGGLGLRMGGGDKPLRALLGRPLLDHAVARVAPQCRALVLNANGDPARFAAWLLPVAADTLPGHPGPLAGILAGMRWAARQHPDARDVLSVPTDTPFLPADLAARLAAGRGDRAIACAASGGRAHPVVALWPVALADALERSLRDGLRRVAQFAAGHGLAEVAFEGPADPFFNVNSAADLACAEALAAGRRSAPCCADTAGCAPC